MAVPWLGGGGGVGLGWLGGGSGLVTGGLELLTSLGRLVVDSAQASPAFQLVAGATGLLVFLLILNQLILFGAALTATDTRGRVKDLATGQHIPPAGSPPRRVGFGS